MAIGCLELTARATGVPETGGCFLGGKYILREVGHVVPWDISILHGGVHPVILGPLQCRVNHAGHHHCTIISYKISYTRYSLNTVLRISWDPRWQILAKNIWVG